MIKKIVKINQEYTMSNHTLLGVSVIVACRH